MSSDEKQLVVQKLEKLAFEGPLYARAGFNRLWNQVTGYGVPRQVEGFQTNTPADQARAMLATFFALWNNWPTGFTKASDINTMVTTTWSGYVSATTTDFTGTKFGELNSTLSTSFSFSCSYVNGNKTTSVTLTNVIANDTVTHSDIPLTVNQDHSGYYCGGWFGCTSYSGPGILSGTKCSGCGNTMDAAWSSNPGKGDVSIYLSFSNAILVSKVTMVLPFGFHLTYGTSSQQSRNATFNFTTVVILTNNFNNIYTALLIDLYTGINTRHSTTPAPLPVPYTAPTFTPAINTTNDRTNAMAGTNTDTIKNNYLSNYLPGLYFRVYQQTWQLLNDMNASWTSLPSTVRTTLAISNVATDFATINGMANTATADNVVANIRTITNFYNTYASNYTNVMRQGTFYGYVVEFLTNLYTPALTYISATDLSAATQTLVTTARTYISSSTPTAAFTTATNSLTNITNVRSQFETAIRNVLQTLVNSLSTLGGNPSDFVMPATVAAAIATLPSVPTNFSDLAAFRITILGHYATWTTAMQAYVKTYIDGYVANATAAGVTPALDATLYKGYVDLSAAPWHVKPEEPGLKLIDADSPNSITTSSSSVTEAIAKKIFWGGAQDVGMTNFTALTNSVTIILNSPRFIKSYNLNFSLQTTSLSALTSIYVTIYGKKGQNWEQVNQLFGSIQPGTTFNSNSMYGLSLTKPVTTPPIGPYTELKFEYVNPNTLAVVRNWYMHSLSITEYTGVMEPTKMAQLRAIYNLFRDANATFEAIGKIRDFYNASYTAGARYLSAADMTNGTYATPYASAGSATLTLQQVVAKCLNYVNADGTTKDTTLQDGDTSFTDLITLMDAANTRFVTALIDRYFATVGTWQTRGITRPAGIPTDGAADKTALTAATTVATRTTYMGRWVTLLDSLKTRTRTVINQAKDLQTWRATSTPYTFVSNPSLSVGSLGMV